MIKVNPFVNDKKPVEKDILSFVSFGLHFNEDVVQKLCPAAISFSDYNPRSLYVPHQEIVRSPRVPRRLDPIDAIALPQARWEHARRMERQKPIQIEPVPFRPHPPLFYMTEVAEDNQVVREIEETATETNRTDSTSDSGLNNAAPRRMHDPIKKLAQRAAEKEFAEMERNWDKYMFEHMDENTAKFIILRHVHDGRNFFLTCR